MIVELLERYLQAVRTFLPGKAQDDILHELSENILSQMDEKEAELGRPLTEAEQEEIIKQHGHPIAVAARYGRRQYLIGPGLFPIYWLTLKLGLLMALAVRFLVAIVTVLVSADPVHQILPALLPVPAVVVPVFAWITGAFIAFEFFAPRVNLCFITNWSPRSLPAVVKRSAVIPRADSMAQIIMGGAFVLWWQCIPGAPYLLFGPAAAAIALGPVWTHLHWPIILLAVAGIVLASVNLASPHWTIARTRVRLALHAATFVVIVMLVRAGNWVVVADGVSNPAQYATAVTIANQISFYCLLCALVITGLQLAWEGVKHFRDPFAPPSEQRWRALRKS
jgi:hypothetical protein